MKTIDIKSFLIGVLLTTNITLALGGAAPGTPGDQHGDGKSPHRPIDPNTGLQGESAPVDPATTVPVGESDMRFKIGLYSVYAFIVVLFWQIPCDIYKGDNKFISYTIPSIGILSSAFLIFPISRN